MKKFCGIVLAATVLMAGPVASADAVTKASSGPGVRHGAICVYLPAWCAK